MSKKECPFKVGDIVRHKSAFLRSIFWYTNVPHNGKVVRVEPNFGPSGLLYVEWSEYIDGEQGILACNVERCK